MRFPKNLLCLAGLLAATTIMPALAADENAFALTLKDHRFDPAEIKVPAGKPITLHIKNLDQSAEEFDSDDLGVEKVIAAGGEGVVHLRALKPGNYTFEGEYHSDTALGALKAE